MSEQIKNPLYGWNHVSVKMPTNIGNYLCITNDDKVMVCHVAANGWWSIVPGAKFYGDMGEKVVIDSKYVDREVVYWKEIGLFPGQVQVEIIESEAGWGAKVDEVKVFDTPQLAAEFIQEFNSKNNESTTPDWYMYARLKS